ncbi:LysR family transcriptional regulator [Puniceibacterium sediminis]|uniref:DNA-binding transcriptional regulator, LysR family n=1 Tax=Puniceibacterium sediminis TaxID=1608407 RepID=A0A238ZG94_9RHOB|nr:LysR family transcriptional regulator [Puniceibacterium sediminis]SNR82347.1 DNA-binding transcriptional regulator, LysR family [Puniceibacterium sediminis]
MISRNLRHLRVFMAVAETGSVTHAADRCHVSQPAVTQALNKLEQNAGGALFDRTRHGFFTTPRGDVLLNRVRRAFDLLDPALDDVSPRLVLTATAPQLTALIAVRETENFTLAALRLNLAQPTVHRAVSQLEQESVRALFERTSYGIIPTRQTRALSQSAQLAFAELDQADADLAELDGREVGRIVVGALPLSRSVILPHALTQFRALRPIQNITVIDGPYSELLGGLRRGDIDFILGALRDPLPIADIVQEPLFSDRLTILCRPDHPLADRTGLKPSDLSDTPWVVTREGTPTRAQFDACFDNGTAPISLIETGSILLMREILLASDHLGCISTAQSHAEISKGLLARLNVDVDWARRPIGLTTRAGWMATKGQALMLDLIRAAAEEARQSIA